MSSESLQKLKYHCEFPDMRKALLVTDLDNTLYDWVTFFAKSFEAMVSELSRQTRIDQDRLLAEFKSVHQRYRNSEQPFAILELPSIKAYYGTSSRSELLRHVDRALYQFNKSRRGTLTLYPGVLRTLARLSRKGIKIVGYTEAMVLNAYWRLSALEIASFFDKLYVLKGETEPHPDPSQIRISGPPEGFVEFVPTKERKPNPNLLTDICRRQHTIPESTVYVGDSLARDISMAKGAGVFAAWARYGTKYERQSWDIITKVTHWTEEDVSRENQLKLHMGQVEPDIILDSFEALLPLFD